MQAEPTSEEDINKLVYYTRRTLGAKGKAVVWVYRQSCPKCKKSLMGKPRGKDGKVKIRSLEYVCPSCNNAVEKKAYEESLTTNIKYVCPSCKNEGVLEIPYKRKKIEGIDTLRGKCEKCSANIDITKKMKEKGQKDDDE